MSTDRRTFLAGAALALPAVALHLGQPSSQAQEQKPAEPAATAEKPDQAELERLFADKLSGCVFAGSYSVTAGAEEKSAVMEKYTITKISKFKDELWHFNAKWQIGKNEFPIVLPLTVKWAGDTPVITLDNLTIPGLGTFSSRVLIHGDWYAGTWLHGKVGGHLWGRIEPI